jgi:antitoxin ParD1/3/4
LRADGRAPAGSGQGRDLARASGANTLPIFAVPVSLMAMTTMNISLPGAMKDFVDEQVVDGGYGSSSEYVRALIRKDQDTLHLRRLLLDGAASASEPPVEADYFDRLRERARGRPPG